MDFLYAAVLLIGTSLEWISDHRPILTLILGALFTSKAIWAWRKREKKLGALLVGMGLLGICLWSVWPAGRYTAHEDAGWLTLKGTVPAGAKLRFESSYRASPNSYSCLKSASPFDSNLSGRSDLNVVFEEEVDFGGGTYTVKVPHTAYRGSCEYRFPSLTVFADGKRLFYASTSGDTGVIGIIKDSDALTLMCYDSSHPEDKWPQMTCSSDLPKQRWGMHDLAVLDVYQLHEENVVVTVNIEFKTPDGGGSLRPRLSGD